MKSRIDITITDHYGDPTKLIDDVFEPYEVYVNDDRVCTSGRLEQLEDKNEKLRELVLKNWYIMLSEREALRQYKCDEAYISSLDEEIGKAKAKMREMGIEVERTDQ